MCGWICLAVWGHTVHPLRFAVICWDPELNIPEIHFSPRLCHFLFLSCLWQTARLSRDNCNLTRQGSKLLASVKHDGACLRTDTVGCAFWESAADLDMLWLTQTCRFVRPRTNFDCLSFWCRSVCLWSNNLFNHLDTFLAATTWIWIAMKKNLYNVLCWGFFEAIHLIQSCL